MKGFDKMKKKEYYLVVKYPHQAAALIPDVRRICKDSRGYTLDCIGPCTIQLGKMSYVKSLWISFRIGIFCSKHFINTNDIQIMIENH